MYNGNAITSGVAPADSPKYAQDSYSEVLSTPAQRKSM